MNTSVCTGTKSAETKVNEHGKCQSTKHKYSQCTVTQHFDHMITETNRMIFISVMFLAMSNSNRLCSLYDAYN